MKIRMEKLLATLGMAEISVFGWRRLIGDLEFKIRRRGFAAATVVLLATSIFPISTAQAFEGRITASLTRGGEAETWLYTVGTNQLRLERGETNRPYPKNLVDLDTGAITLLFPHNRSFVRLKPEAAKASAAGMPGFPEMPLPPGGVPLGIGSRAAGDLGSPPVPAMPARPNLPQMPPGAGPQSGAFGATAALPTMPAMAPPMMERMELKATGQTTNLLGYPCDRYEIKQRGEVMEIWATDKLLPFQPFLQSQPHPFGPRRIEEEWGDLLKAKKLFPLLAVLKFEPPGAPAGTAPAAAGPERMRFEVKAITREKIRDGSLFQPPPDYQEVQPLPF